MSKRRTLIRENGEESQHYGLTDLNQANEALKARGRDLFFGDLDTMPLDATVLKDHVIYSNDTFGQMKVAYLGGALNLEDVTFKDDAILLRDSPNARQFVQAILETQGEHVSLTLPR